MSALTRVTARRIGIASALGAFLVGFAPLVPAAEAVDTPTEVASVTVSRTLIETSGFATVPLRIEVGLRDAEGVSEGPSDYDYDIQHDPAAIFTWQGTGAAPFKFGVGLRLTSGTAQDGVWAGTLPVPAVANGSWRLEQIVVDSCGVSCGGTPPTVVPVPTDKQVTVTVHGTRIPRLSVGVSQDPLPYGSTPTYKGRLTADGVGLAGVVLQWGVDTECVEGASRLPAGRATTTNANGYYAYSAHDILCVRIFGTERSPGPRIVHVERFIYFPKLYPAVRLHLAVATVAAGSSVGADGAVYPALPACRVQLQRRLATGWQTVATAPVRTSGRYSLSFTAEPRGRWAYRTLVPAGTPDCNVGSRLVSGSSSVRWLTVT